MSGGPPHQLSIGGRMITKSSIIAKEMNKFFMNKVKAVRESITFLPNSFSKCREIMKTKRCRLTLNHVSVEKVNKLLKGLKNTKSIALDELDNFCIKAAADILDKPVHHIISMSIMQNKFWLSLGKSTFYWHYCHCQSTAQTTTDWNGDRLCQNIHLEYRIK